MFASPTKVLQACQSLWLAAVPPCPASADPALSRPFPHRVSGALEGKSVRHVAAGLHLTVAVTTGGRVFQMGATGASAAKHCPWEGATTPEWVKGALAGAWLGRAGKGRAGLGLAGWPQERRLLLRVWMLAEGQLLGP